MIEATAPELCQKCDFFLRKRMKEIVAYVLKFMLTLAKCKITVLFNCTCSYVYRVFWSSGRFVDSNILILFRHMTTGLLEHLIYRTKRTVRKA